MKSILKNSPIDLIKSVGFEGKIQSIKDKDKQDKYTMDPGQSSLAQQKVKKKFSQKLFFEQKKDKKCINHE